jgi:hypothetical protein
MAMAKYIDADQIVFWIRYVSSNGLDSDVRKIAFSDEIARMPAADVVEVRHGVWINDICSVCRMDLGIYDIEWFNYCPFCGSKMDGKDGAE